jgi:hypothetical protein
MAFHHQQQLQDNGKPDGHPLHGPLSMAAFFFHWLVLEHLQPSLQHTMAQIWCDNMAAISWATKLKSGTDPLANRIL